MSRDRFGDYSNVRRRERLAMPIRPLTAAAFVRFAGPIVPPPPAVSELIVPGLADGASVLPAPVEGPVVTERRYPIVGVDWGDGFSDGPVS